MPRSSFRTNRTSPALAAMLAAWTGCAAAASLSCSGHKSSVQTPVASLARSQDAQAAFQAIRTRWELATPAERVALEPQLRAFRDRFSGDPLARVADVYLAFIALQAGRLDQARGIAQQVEAGPAGNTRDLATLVQGALWLRANQPERALDALAPLEGKLLDEFAGELLYETIVDAAVQAHRWSAAARYMNDWVREADDPQRRAIRPKLDSALRRFPPEALEKTLEQINRDPRPDVWDKDMRAAVATRLGQIAVEHADARLARSVIETSRTVDGMGDAGSELEQLASLGASMPTVAGRTVGLVVPTARTKLRDRATDAIQGALEVLRPSATATADTLPVLRIHEAGDDLEDVIKSLDELERFGASVAIAGFDPGSASAAAGWAEAESMPVVLLVRPSHMPPGARFVFVLGEDEAAVGASVVQQAGRAAEGKVGRIVPAGSPSESDTAPCDAASPVAGGPRFPFPAWKTDKVASIAVTGGAWCAQDVMSELQAMRWQPPVVLGLSALGADTPPGYWGVVWQALAGRLGPVRGTALDDAMLAGWRASHGAPPDWFAALGHDAALLALAATSVLPMDTTTDQRQVERRRAQVQQALLEATGTLWSTTERGFGGALEMKREIRYDRIAGK